MGRGTRGRRRIGLLVPLVIAAVVAWQFIPGRRLGADGAEHLLNGYRIGEGSGIAVAILVDTSGSMRHAAGDGGSENHVEETRDAVARRALSALAAQLDAWATGHPGRPLLVGLYTFSNLLRTVIPLRPFEAAKLRDAVERLVPPPHGGTALGGAMHLAASELAQSAPRERHLFVLTDGENTVGSDPARVAETIAREASAAGDVAGIRLHFVAFDTDAEPFAFVRAGRGTLSSAAGAELEGVVARVFREILLEAPDEEALREGAPASPGEDRR